MLHFEEEEEQEQDSSVVYVRLKCKYLLHKHCADLPLQQFSHQAHPDENEYSEFICNSCEQRRELYDPTYYCQAVECHCVAHVHCQLSE
ncbi:unnamed protein product [Camellia sinensis]